MSKKTFGLVAGAAALIVALATSLVSFLNDNKEKLVVEETVSVDSGVTELDLGEGELESQ